MAGELIGGGRLVTLVLFLALLGLVWLLVRMARDSLSSRLQAGRRLRVIEVLALSQGDQALILQAEGRDFLLIRCKGATPLLQELTAPRIDPPDAPLGQDALP